MLKIIQYICIFLIIVLVLFVLESIREHRKFQVINYTVDSKRLSKVFNGTKLLLIADWHNTHFGKDNETFLEKVRECKPDYILIAGDMIVCKKSHRAKNKTSAALIHKLSEIAPVYYAFGNHEFGVRAGVHDTDGLWEEYMQVLDLEHHDSIKLLDQSSCFIEKNQEKISITGLTLDKTHFKRFIMKKFDKSLITKLYTKDDCFRILMAHNPDYFDTYVEADADLVVSGHNHGGVLRLPFLGGVISPRFHIFPRYDKGKYEKNDTTMILSGGLGTHSIPFRVNNLPELVLILLQNNGK